MVLVIALSFTFAKDFKVAYFDSEQVMQNWGEWKDAQAKFDQNVLEWQEDAQEMEDSLNQLMEDYQRQELLLSADKKQEKQMIIQQKQLEYQEFLATIFGESGLATQRNAELTAPLYERINQSLSKIAEREGISVVFDGASSGIAYIDPSLDLTEDLVEELKSVR